MIVGTAIATPPSRTPSKQVAGSATPTLHSPPKKGALYQHYKGGLFRAIDLCVIKGTNTIGVLYKAIDPHARQDLWMRPLNEFSFQIMGRPRFAEVPQYGPSSMLEYTNEVGLTHDVVAEVLSRYDEPARFFHTREHLHQMFYLAKTHKVKLSKEQVIAILFHDAIYTPGAEQGVNEKMSLLLMHDYAHRLGEFNATAAAQIIVDTITHEPLSDESAIVQDLDKSSIASSTLEFTVANEQIWLEHRHLLESENRRKDFDTRRLGFLIGLAEQSELFTTPTFEYLNKAAYDNIEMLRLQWLETYQA